MAELSQLETALVNADKAGDTAAATTLAGEIKRMRGATPAASVGAAFAKGEASKLIPDTPPQPVAKPEDRGAKDFMSGLPGAGVAIAEGTGKQAIGSIVAAVRQVASRMTGADPEQARLEGQGAAETVTGALPSFQPSPQAQRTLGTLEDVGSATKLSGLNPAMPLGHTAPGAFKTVGKLAKEAPGEAARALKSAVTPAEETAAMARKAQEFGIEIPPHKLSDNRFVRLIGEALDNVPAAGSVGEKNQVAFNSALGKMIGADDAKRITRLVFDKAMTKSGRVIGDVAERTPVPVKSLDAALDAQLESAKASGLADVEKMIGGYVKEIRDAANADGVIDGKAYRRISTKIGNKVREMAPGDRKMALDALHDDMMQALYDNVSPADREPLADARRQYAIGKTIEPLVAKAPGGNVPPSQLLGVLTRDKAGKSRMARGKGGDLGDLADVAQLFMKDQPSSITTERGLAYGALGVGGSIGLGPAAGVYGAANLYNRLGPKVTKRLVRDLEPNTPIGEQQ